MKYPGHPSNVFCEQVGTVTTLFEQWNECERTVVLYALLKRVPFANLKFLQLSIEYNIAQNYNSQSRLQILESNSNNGVFLAKLLGTYKGTKADQESVIYEALGKRERKEDILTELLTYLPLLKPGNEDAKAVYMAIVPIAVDDSVRQLVPTELVQQILSYLLIHPAVTSDDRRYLIDNTMLTIPLVMRSLGHWLHNLEEYISSPYGSKSQSCLLDTNGSTNSSTTTLWQSPATTKTECATTKWGGVFCDDGATPLKEFRKTIGKNVEFKATGGGPLYETPSDDQDVSFSKNGTEILDFDDENKSNTKIAFESLTLRDLLAVPSFLDGAAAMLKTRRSNSLTTASGQVAPSSASAENLAQMAQKPRSFSLTTVEGAHGVQALTAGGSETRLDDFRPSLMKTPSHQAGMSGIGQWLKSLRLHKYVWLFTNITYEQMMDITEEHLQNLGVTKGARHKLVLCIQKLRERHGRLLEMEKGLLGDQAFLAPALEELANVVLTPMKPVNHYGKEDVASQFYKVIELITTLLASKAAAGQVDEETIGAFMWVLERALHNEAFVAQTNQLKEFKYKMSKVKMQFGASTNAAKTHYSKTSMNVLGKARWTPGVKPHKSSDKCGRKNSTGTLPGYPMGLQQPPYAPPEHLAAPQHHHHQTPSHYSKSSSYPNFSSSTKPLHHAFPAQPTAYHRHSLNSLMGAKNYFNKENAPRAPPAPAAPTFSSVLGQQNAAEARPAVPKEAAKGAKSTIGEINSRLEFLCLQMTEQAIN